MKTIEERFWARVDKDPGHGPYGDCWLWLGGKHDFGYGRFRMGKRHVLSHRVAWALGNKQPIPKLLQIRHTCDNPPCVNPSHLLLGTQKDNVQDTVDRGRTARGNRNGAYTHPDRIPRGERQGKSSLTDFRVKVIREEALSGMHHGNLAHLFGVSRPTISRIVSRKIWRHVP